MADPRDPNLQGALFFYSLGAYPRLEKLTKFQIGQIVEELQDFSGVEPLARDKEGKMPSREIPHVGKMSLVQAYAWMGAIVVARQYEIEGPVWLADKSYVLAPCVEAYKLHRPAVQGRLVLQ